MKWLFSGTSDIRVVIKIKSLLNYPGGKWSMADWIISQFPKHTIYLEPFCGSAAVFFNKQPSEFETINDIDGRIENFFSVCRDYPEELAHALFFSPYSRKGYENIKEGAAGQEIKLTGNRIEDARRFLIRCNQGFGSKLADRVGWKNSKSSKGGSKLKKWNQLPEIVFDIAKRLKNAQIECKPALGLISQYNFSDCLIYVDPPYLFETRTRRLYSHEMGKRDEHKKLLELLMQHSGPVILSGYNNNLYDELLVGWSKISKNYTTNSGQVKSEVLWANFEINDQISLFDEIRQKEE